MLVQIEDVCTLRDSEGGNQVARFESIKSIRKYGRLF